MESKSQYGGQKRRPKSQGRKVVKIRRSNASSSMYNKRTGEVKSIDAATASLTFPNNSAVSAIVLNDSAAGTDYFNRIGRKESGISLRVRGECEPPAAGAVLIQDDFLRCIVFLDKQHNGVAATWADLCLAQNGGGSASDVMAGLNMNNRDRFKVLREFTLKTPLLATAGGGGQSLGPSYPISKELIFDEFIKGPFETMHSSAALGAITTGALCMIGQSTGGTGWTMTFSARYRFVE